MSISRATLPENFYDKTSDRLLSQPEPQYPLAQLFLNAVGTSLPVPSGMGLDGRQVPAAGAPYASADRDRLKLAEALPASLFEVSVDFSKEPGDTVRLNRPAFQNTTYTKESRRISANATITTQPIGISSEQTHLVLERYAGPYDQANGRVAPIGIDAFSSSYGVHRAPDMVGTHLVRDFHRFLDAVHVEMADAAQAIYPEGMTQDDDATLAGSFPLTLEQLSRLEEEMDDANLPTLPDGARVLMLTPRQFKQLKHDPEYQAQAERHPEFNLLFPNYVGSVSKWHIFKSTTLKRVANTSSVPIHRGIAIAPGAFMGGMGRAPRVAPSTDDNFGETAKVIWLAYLAFGVADIRFFRSVRSA